MLRPLRPLTLALLLLSAVGTPAEPDPSLPDPTATLTTKTFTNAVETAEQMLVLFHDSDCPYCPKMRAIFAQIRADFADKYPSLRFAALNVEDNETVKDERMVLKTPELRLYLHGDIFALYVQGMDLAKIQGWVDGILEETKTARLIRSEKDYQLWRNTPVAAFLSLPEVTDRHRQYADNLARIFPAVPVFWAESHSKFDDRIVADEEERYFYHFKFKRNFDDGDKEWRAVEGFRPEAVVRWMMRLSKPAVTTLTPDVLSHILNDGIRAVVLFDRTLNTPLMNRFEFSALKSNDTCLFVKTTVDDGNAQTLARTLGVQESEFPALRAMVAEGTRLRKFRFDGELTQRRIFNFLYDFERGDLAEYYKNGKYVNNYGKDFNTYNRKQFLKVTEKGRQDVFVCFTGKWCPDCGEVPTVLSELAKRITLHRDTIVLAQVDVDENDVDTQLSARLPAIQLYKKGAPKRPLLYGEKFTPDAVLKYLERELGRKFAREADAEDEDPEYEEEIPEGSGLDAPNEETEL